MEHHQGLKLWVIKIVDTRICFSYGCTGGVSARHGSVIFAFLLIVVFSTLVPPSHQQGRPDETHDNTSTQQWQDQQTERHDKYLTRLNYGFSAIAEKQVSLVHGYWTHTFHFTLPSDEMQDATRPSRHRLARCNDICEAMKPMHTAVINMTRNFRTSVSSLVDRIKFLIPELPVSESTGRTRLGRGAVDAVGYASRWLFGTACSSDIKGLQKSLDTVKSITSTVAADAARTRAGMATFTRLANQRFDRMHEMMQREEASFAKFYTDYRDVMNSTTSVVAVMANEVTEFVRLHDDLQEIESGIEAMLHGQLTPRLIPHTELATIIDVVRRQLDTSVGRLIYTTALETYAVQNFDYARMGNDLVIRLHLPYKREDEMNVYKVETFPLPVPGKQGLISTLVDMPQYVLTPHVGPSGVVSMTGTVGEINRLPDGPVLHYADVQWRGLQSCIWALLVDDHAAVHQRCSFSVRRGDIEPQVLRLDVGLFIATDPTVVEIACPGEQPHMAAADKSLKLLRLECGCSLRYDRANFALETVQCPVNFSQTETVLSAVNLAILQHFYDLSDEIVSGSRLYLNNQTSQPAPLQIPLFGENVSQWIADDEQASYSLTKLAEHLENNSVVIHSQAEALLYQYIDSLPGESSFWALNTSNLFLWCLCIGNAIVLFLVLYLMVTVRLLRGNIQAVATMTGTALPILAQAFQLKTPSAASTQIATTTLSMTDEPTTLFDDRFHFDWLTIGAIIFFGVCVVIKLICCLKNHGSANRRSSVLYIVVRTATQMTDVRYYNFPDASRNFTLKVARHQLRVALQNFGIFGKLILFPPRWEVRDTLTGRTIQLPPSIWIGYFKLRAIKKIMRQGNSFDVLPLIVHTHDYDYVGSDVVSAIRDELSSIQRMPTHSVPQPTDSVV